MPTRVVHQVQQTASVDFIGCGCCGREYHGDGWFCPDCDKHVDKKRPAPWDQTYFAQHGKDCPFSEKVTA